MTHSSYKLVMDAFQELNKATDRMTRTLYDEARDINECCLAYSDVLKQIAGVEIAFASHDSSDSVDAKEAYQDLQQRVETLQRGVDKLAQVGSVGELVVRESILTRVSRWVSLGVWSVVLFGAGVTLQKFQPDFWVSILNAK